MDIAALAEGHDGPSANAQRKSETQAYDCDCVGVSFLLVTYLWTSKDK